MSKDNITKLMKHSVYGVNSVNNYKRTKDNDKVKFHTKPTQVNRKNPILVLNYPNIVKAWLYELDNGYTVIFRVFDGTRSEAVVAKFNGYDDVHILDFTKIDIHTKQDLVEFVTEYNKYSNFDMVDIDY